MTPGFPEAPLPGGPDSDSSGDRKPALASCEALPLDEQAKALLADIAAFDIEAARRRVQKMDARYSGIGAGKASATADFPEVRLQRELPPAAPAPAVEPAPTAADVPLPSLEPPAGGAGSSLLGELKDEVADRKRAEGEAARRGDAARSLLDRRLREVFEYFHDLTGQLNYLKPRVARRYYFLDSNDSFCDLAWREGYADIRSQSEQLGGRIQRVTLGYTLGGPGLRTVTRSGAAVERLRQVLFDLGLKFECQERRNRQREVEQAIFTVQDEIGVQVVWQADFERQAVVVESRNLERLGYATCTLPVASLGPALLDEFGRLMLGRENNFRRYVSR